MIYLDNAATTKPDGECVKAAEKYLYTQYFNPSALYKGGYGLQQEINSAGKNIVSLIANTENFDCIFTSCGTESDNQAIFCGGKRGNVVVSEGEHSAVLSAVNELKQRGIEIRYAKINADGGADKQSLLELVDEKTSLVSVMHVNNETGAVNDILSIAKAVKAKNKYCLFHSDGVQAFGKIPFKLSGDVDLYTISAHKINGVKGCGALIKRKNLAIKPYIYSGGQGQGLQSGTENVFGIKNFEFSAVKKYTKITENYKIISELNSLLWEKLDKSLFIKISGENSSPYILSVSAKGLRGETILHECDDNGVLIGTGSACSSNDKKRFSSTILACGYEESVADGVLRLSFCSENTREEVLAAAEILNKVVANRKAMMA